MGRFGVLAAVVGTIVTASLWARAGAAHLSRPVDFVRDAQRVLNRDTAPWVEVGSKVPRAVIERARP
jgi:hypothetical protein